MIIKKLRDARIFREMTQQALSDATGINIRLIQQYEAGTRKPKNINLEKLARALNINAKALSPPCLLTDEDVMFTLFEMEKRFGRITLETINDKVAVCIDNSDLVEALSEWSKAKRNNYKECLEEWKLTYPKKENIC